MSQLPVASIRPMASSLSVGRPRTGMFCSPRNSILISRPLALTLRPEPITTTNYIRAATTTAAGRGRASGQLRFTLIDTRNNCRRSSKDNSNTNKPATTTGSVPVNPPFNIHSHIQPDQHPEPCSSASGLFSSSISGTTTTSGRTIRATNKNPTLTGNRHTCITRTGQGVVDTTANSTTTAANPFTNTNNSFFSGLHRPFPKRQMAFNAYSTPTSDISTPRSSSPAASAISGRSSHSTVSSKRLSLSLSRRQSAFNPMSSVDIHAIEEQMKMAALDGLRGYAQDHYAEVEQYSKTEYVSKAAASGYQVLREPLWNKGMNQSRFLHMELGVRPGPALFLSYKESKKYLMLTCPR